MHSQTILERIFPVLYFQYGCTIQLFWNSPNLCSVKQEGAGFETLSCPPLRRRMGSTPTARPNPSILAGDTTNASASCLTSTFSYLSSPFRLSPFLFLCIIHCVGPSRHSFVITILVIHHVGPKATFRRNSMPNSFDTPTAAVARRSASASLVDPRNYQ